MFLGFRILKEKNPTMLLQYLQATLIENILDENVLFC